MNDATRKTSISDELGANIPYLRRFARAMTGRQSSGDTFAAVPYTHLTLPTNSAVCISLAASDQTPTT